MPEVLIRCPVTRKQLSTGIVLDPDVFARNAFKPMAIRCPHCGLMHSWTQRDAYLRR